VYVALYKKNRRKATERHLPYGITQYYLPPDQVAHNIRTAWNRLLFDAHA